MNIKLSAPKLTHNAMTYHYATGCEEQFAPVTFTKKRLFNASKNAPENGIKLTFDTAPNNTRSRQADVTLTEDDLWNMLCKLHGTEQAAILRMVGGVNPRMRRSDRACLILDLMHIDHRRMTK